jgi:3-deoxy-D-manno-oct-2-ulosonic acid (Kdo) hydroxylase
LPRAAFSAFAFPIFSSFAGFFSFALVRSENTRISFAWRRVVESDGPAFFHVSTVDHGKKEATIMAEIWGSAATLEAQTEPTNSMEERLERGDVVFFPKCPFPLPEGEDRTFLLEQQLAGRVHKNIGYDPRTGKASGFQRRDAVQAERLRSLLADFSRTTTEWVTRTLPSYSRNWQLDRVSFRPEEEATRRLRLTARNDLLHIDAFPSRPTNGWRILRVFANVNLTEPRIWITSDPFAKLLERFGLQVGLPGRHPGTLTRRLRQSVVKLFRPKRPARSDYDDFMLRFHNFLKANEEFQERCRKRFWKFPPGSAWLVITDTASHAALRGRFALEHSYFLSPGTLALPEESPPALLERACGRPVLLQAA